jgi:hypothetical protein
VWDTIFPEPKNPEELWFGIPSRKAVYGLQALLTLTAIGLSLDSFIYPQSHFFLIASFLSALALFSQGFGLKGKKQLLYILPAIIISILLLLANTVTGTAAAGLVGTLAFIRIFDRKRSIKERAIYLVIGFAVLALMHSASAGRSSFLHPHFSVSSASDMIRAGLPYLFVLAASMYVLSRKQYIAIASILVGFLGFITFFLSDRNIVTENASRFLYHGFLIGYVLLIGPVISYAYYLRREIQLTTRPVSEIITGWVSVISMLAICFLPIGISAGSTYSSLLKNDTHTISFNTQLALWWIGDHAKPLDVVISNPNEPFLIPLFTHSAMLRANDYWLSLQDETLTQLTGAFAGNKSDQQKVLKQGKFLLLTSEEQKTWDVSKLKKVFESSDAIVYSTGY